jgi:hypothetical protein
MNIKNCVVAFLAASALASVACADVSPRGESKDEWGTVYDPGNYVDLKTFPEKFRMPRIAPGSNEASAKAIIALEAEVEKDYNGLFLKDPEAMAKKHYLRRPDRHMYDVVSPSAFEGDDLDHYWRWVGAQYDGLYEQTDMLVYADENIGWVRLIQVYAGKNYHTGEPFRWVMRQTDGVVKINGEWKIAHTHWSWPANIDTLQADKLSRNNPRPWDPESHRYGRKVVVEDAGDK